MLEVLRSRIEGRRALLLAVGNSLRGDDAAGPCLAERLRGKVEATVVDAGDVPENYLGLVAAAGPEVVVIIDAAQLGASPGDATMIEARDLGGASWSTHNPGLRLFVQALQSEIQVDVVVVGIQPGSTEYGAPMSSAVSATVGLLQELFQRCWAPAAASRPEDDVREQRVSRGEPGL